MNREILGGLRHLPLELAGRQHFGNFYIERGYRTGMRNSVSALERGGATVRPEYIGESIRRHPHIERIGSAYSRNFTDLANMTDTMSDRIAETMAEGMAAGHHHGRIVGDLVSRVEGLGKARARLIARTEIIAAHASAQLGVFIDAGIDEVDVDAELSTAGDERVCDICEEAARAGPYQISAIENMIPIHPNCRCAWAPVVTGVRGVKL
jgi:SPP1 gp7 family putative phage head morphogenesis protein